MLYRIGGEIKNKKEYVLAVVCVNLVCSNQNPSNCKKKQDRNNKEKHLFHEGIFE